MRYALTADNRSYAVHHLHTAMRTLPWYILPPALLGAMLMLFLYFVAKLAGGDPDWRAFGGVSLAAGMLGLFLWMMRQFVRIIQLARHYAR